MRRKIMKARTRLLMTEPFFAVILSGLKVEESTEFESMATDGETLKYNKEYVLAMSMFELEGNLLHEAMHLAMSHHVRMGNRDLERWNVACDYAINPLLIERGYSLPGCINEEKYKDMSAEMIYARLPNNTNKAEPTPMILPCKNSKAAIKSKESILVSKKMAEMRGIMSGSLARSIAWGLRPRVNWRDELSEFIEMSVVSDYTWTVPNGRYSHLGLYLPSLSKNESEGEVIVIIDTSGSVSPQTLSKFAAEISSIRSSYQGLAIRVIYCDSEVSKDDFFDVGDDLSIFPVGGGGTDFAPPFEWIKEKQYTPLCVVYITDGRCDSFPDTPEEFSTLWAIDGDINFTPPFGRVINMEEL